MGIKFLTAFFFVLCAHYSFGQDKSALQKQRDQLKNEISQTEKILNETKKTATVNIGQLSLINKKLDLQGNVIQSINGEIKNLNNDIYTSQLEVNKMKRVLDTLKQEYAKSMVYAYKNKNNYDFLNFIFSAHNFNDAIKRVAYLKSYRNYREKQGENIVNTQVMMEDKIALLSGKKKLKSNVLNEQGKELTLLENQQQEKATIVNELKGKTKELSSQINSKRKQDVKLSNAISTMIRREIELARIEAAKKEKARLDELNRRKAEEAATAKAAKDAAAIAAAEIARKNTKVEPKATEKVVAANPVEPVKIAPKPVVKEPVRETVSTPKPNSSVLVRSEADIALNTSFERNKGSLPWPVNGFVITHFGLNKFPGGIDYYEQGVTIGTKIGEPVKAIFDGEVTMVSYVDNVQTVFIKHGKYFTVYSNLESVNVQKGSQVKTGQQLGKAGVNEEGAGGSVQFVIMNELDNVNPESWLRK
ncbi:MAG: peptidoglycan DD-metalloendopeptidase family protein [Ginsengibacter sp.]